MCDSSGSTEQMSARWHRHDSVTCMHDAVISDIRVERTVRSVDWQRAGRGY